MGLQRAAQSAVPPVVSNLDGEAEGTGFLSSTNGRWVWPSVVVVAYVALGMIAYSSAIPDLTGRLTGSDGDFIESVWFIGWVPHALDHWLNPFFSDAMYAPQGVNLAQNTSSPFLGLLTYPISRLASPLASVNLLMVLAMPASATAAFVVLRKWSVWGPAAALGGAIYGFSPYMVGQGLGHPELMFIPIPPFIALTIEAILRRRGNPRRLGVQLGILVTVQYLISPEVMAVVGLLSLAALAYLAVRNRSAWLAPAGRILEPMIIAIGVVAVVLAYPVWMLVAGPQHHTGPTQRLVNPYHNDMLSFVIPGPLQRVSFGLESQWSGPLGKFQPTEDGGYIGIPLLLLATAFAWCSRHRARMQLSVVLLTVAGLLSLGSTLYVRGRTTHIPLPFAVVKDIPLLNDILPSRISFATSAFLAAVIAFGLDDWHRRELRTQRAAIRAGRWNTSAAGLLAVATLIALVVSQLPSWPYTSAPSSALPPAVEHAIPHGNPVTITYPYTASPVLDPLLWQSEGDFTFSIVGGYARHAKTGANQDSGAATALSPMHPPQLQRFLVGYSYAGLLGANPSAPSSLISGDLVKTRTALARDRVQLVLVDRSWGGAHSVLRLFRRVLGPPDHTLDSYSLWVHVQRVLKQRAPRGARRGAQ
jgi:hypothetical protein